MTGYATACFLLDAIGRQRSEDRVEAVPAGEPLVDGVERLAAPH